MPSQQKMSGEQLVDVQKNADSAASLLKNLANPHRLLVLCVLASKEMSVSEINACVDLSQSALSQHLARLRADNLVITRRDSQTIYYSIADGPAMQLIHVLQQYYCHN
ncbi:transcriptional regulator, ArsR family [Alteromonadaceae bacterium Bs31]|nr:transcriptional regulator, ArsR family [Alteromonadaceae bacterium Bs31]